MTKIAYIIGVIQLIKGTGKSNLRHTGFMKCALQLCFDIKYCIKLNRQNEKILDQCQNRTSKKSKNPREFFFSDKTSLIKMHVPYKYILLLRNLKE